MIKSDNVLSFVRYANFCLSWLYKDIPIWSWIETKVSKIIKLYDYSKNSCITGIWKSREEIIIINKAY